MFRKMRRFKQQLSESEVLDVLERGSSGVLAVLGDDDYPYAVPLSYVYDDGKIYFHSATQGHKLDAVKKHKKASFCVIDHDQVMPDEDTTYFRSVIAFGQTRLLDDDAEKRAAIEKLSCKYSKNLSERSLKEIEREFRRFSVIELSIEHMSGKEARELRKQKALD